MDTFIFKTMRKCISDVFYYDGSSGLKQVKKNLVSQGIVGLWQNTCRDVGANPPHAVLKRDLEGETKGRKSSKKGLWVT